MRNEDKKNLFNLFFLNLLNVTLELLTIGALFPLFYFLLKSDFSDTGIFQFLFLTISIPQRHYCHCKISVGKFFHKKTINIFTGEQFCELI